MPTQTGSYDLKAAKSSTDVADAAQQTANQATITIDDLDLFINGGFTVETDSPYSESQLSVDKGVFYEKTGGVYGSYTFAYNGSVWKLNGTTVNLVDYGIFLDATPSSGNTIVVDLIEVDGAMSDLTEQYNSLSATVDANELKAAGDLESAMDSLTGEDGVITNQNAVIAGVQSSLRDVSTKTQNMGWSDNYGLVLYAPGATFDTGYKLQLAASAINFRNGSLNTDSSIMSSIAADQNTGTVFMVIADAIIENQLRFGNFAFIPRTNNHMSLKYLG